MNSITLFLLFVPVLALILLGVNLVFAPHNPYQEKSSTFECGFHSFLGQNRTQFNVSFFSFGLLFLIFDLELLGLMPGMISIPGLSGYGVAYMLIFFSVLTVGFAFELGKKALKIDSRQDDSTMNNSLELFYIVGSVAIKMRIVSSLMLMTIITVNKIKRLSIRFMVSYLIINALIIIPPFIGIIIAYNTYTLESSVNFIRMIGIMIFYIVGTVWYTRQLWLTFRFDVWYYSMQIHLLKYYICYYVYLCAIISLFVLGILFSWYLDTFMLIDSSLQSFGTEVLNMNPGGNNNGFGPPNPYGPYRPTGGGDPSGGGGPSGPSGPGRPPREPFGGLFSGSGGPFNHRPFSSGRTSPTFDHTMGNTNPTFDHATGSTNPTFDHTMGNTSEPSSSGKRGPILYNISNTGEHYVWDTGELGDWDLGGVSKGRRFWISVWNANTPVRPDGANYYYMETIREKGPYSGYYDVAGGVMPIPTALTGEINSHPITPRQIAMFSRVHHDALSCTLDLENQRWRASSHMPTPWDIAATYDTIPNSADIDETPMRWTGGWTNPLFSHTNTLGTRMEVVPTDDPQEFMVHGPIWEVREDGSLWFLFRKEHPGSYSWRHAAPVMPDFWFDEDSFQRWFHIMRPW